MSQSECIHFKQIAFQVYLSHTLNHETQSRVNAKVSTKYLEKHTKIHLKQLHAKDGTQEWNNGLDALRYFNEVHENIPLP
jgi:hypothetical protein